jgi:AMMECR1 domain-containing protein
MSILNVGRSVKPQRCAIPMIDAADRGPAFVTSHRQDATSGTSRGCAGIREVTARFDAKQ